MPAKIAFKDVKDFIKDTDCKLLTRKKDYSNITTKIKFRCSCGNTFEKTFRDFRDAPKQLCPKCSRKGLLKKDIRTVRKEVKSYGLKLISKTYSKNDKPLKVRCKEGHTFEKSLVHLRLNSSCPKCLDHYLTIAKVKKVLVKGITLIDKPKSLTWDTSLTFKCKCGKLFKRTYDAYIRTKGICNSCSRNTPELEEINQECKDKNVKLLQNGSPLKVECKKCGLKFRIKYQDLLKTKDLCICNVFTYSRIKNIIKRKYKNLIKIERYKFKFKCNKCSDRVWRSIKYCTREPICDNCLYDPHSKKFNFKYVKTVVEKNGCKLLSKTYKDLHSKLKIKCKCGKHFNKSFNSILNNQNKCSNCIGGTSVGERQVARFVKYLGVEYVANDRTILDNNKELDIYIPDYKLAIEYNGLYWHNETHVGANYHLEKTQACKEKGVQLFHIFEDEWRDPVKRKIWKSMIRNKLGKSNRIYARKCKIKEVSSGKAKKFLICNHLQGSINSSVRLGLYYEGKLVCVLTVGKSRFNKKYQYEIHRIATKRKHTVVGGVSRLWKHFLDDNSPESIITYADRRFSEGFIYHKLGFEFRHISRPNYFYIDPNNLVRHSRQKYQKHKLESQLIHFDAALTESQNMFHNGFGKVFDSGNMVFAYDDLKENK
jgi:hypothetical protein